MQMDRRALVLSAGATAFLGGCVTQAQIDPRSLAADLFETTPENQADTYANAHLLGPARRIARGARVLALPPHAVSLDALTYGFDGEVRNIDQYMAQNRCAGLIVVKGGRIAIERYAMGACPRTRWAGFSVAKPITSTLVGVALAENAIRSLDDPAERYAPRLRGSAYEGVTIRNLLRLMSGVAWNEDYETSGGSGLVSLVAAVHTGERDAAMRLMRALPRAAPQGEVFNYNTGEAYVLGEVVRGAVGMNLSAYLSEAIWSRLGMERDGYWLTCGAGGPELGGYGVSACLRDYARFGLFVARDGLVRGRRLLPHGWRDLAGQPDNPVTANGNLEEGYPLGHAYMWWSMPTGADAMPNHDGAFNAEGIHGQILYINPKEDVVAVILSAWREPWLTSREMETFALLGAAVERLRQ